MKIILFSVLLCFAVCVQAGTVTIKAGSFSVTTPTAPITVNEASATAFTFDVGLVNSDATEVTGVSVALYLSDNANLAASGAKVSAAISVTGGPTTVAGDDDGTTGKGLTTGMTASVQVLVAADCAAYTKLCIKVTPDDAVECVDITTNCVDDATTAAPSASDAPDMTTKGDENGAEFVHYSVSVMLILFFTTLLFRQN